MGVSFMHCVYGRQGALCPLSVVYLAHVWTVLVKVPKVDLLPAFIRTYKVWPLELKPGKSSYSLPPKETK